MNAVKQKSAAALACALLLAALLLLPRGCRPGRHPAESLVRDAMPAEDLTILAWGPHDEAGELVALCQSGARPRPDTPRAVSRLLIGCAQIKGPAALLRVRYKLDREPRERDEVYLVSGGLARLWAAQPWGDDWRERARECLGR